MGAARALCGREGMTCNLGTGSFACYYDGKKIAKSSPGIGYILGDEGSGAYLGKKSFNTISIIPLTKSYAINLMQNLLPTGRRYWTTCTRSLWLTIFFLCHFLAENRGHYMIENIIEDEPNDFFFNHIYKYEGLDIAYSFYRQCGLWF